MIVYQCEDTMESIFTAIYNAYEEQRDHNDTRIVLHQEFMLFAQYVPVEADSVKAMKVIRTLKRRFGEDDYHSICSALASPDPEKAQAVYQTIVKGIDRDLKPGQLLQNLADDDCNKVFSLARAATRECQHLLGFVRFREIQSPEDTDRAGRYGQFGQSSQLPSIAGEKPVADVSIGSGILYSAIGPKNDVLPFMMPHFADRLPRENFVIYDANRGAFGIHPAGKQWYLLRGVSEEMLEEKMSITREEEDIAQLFIHFCKSIAIKERENKKLQQNMLPLRFREYMVEFK